MDAETYEMMNGLHKNHGLLKVATVAQLREIRERMNTLWKRRIDEELAARDEVAEAPARQPERWSAEWQSRPGTVARFIEEDEAIHGVS